MSNSLTPGTVLGDTWQLEVLLGRGGMGEVWQAKHTRVLGKKASIKALHSLDTASDEMVARFRREAEIAARLEHPNIVHIFDYAVLPSGQPYLVMELLRGETLKERLERGPLSLDETKHLVLQVGSALSVAHSQGVIHRDLKPENLFLVSTPTGTLVKVLDFGISKLLGSNTVQTGNSVMIGTPMYMSPEQALGENDRLTPRSDVFSLAIVAYEALAGRPPFNNPSLVKVVQAIVNDQPAPLPNIPDTVATALEGAFEKDAEARSSVEDFVKQFCGVTLEKPVVRRRSAVVTRLLSTVRSPTERRRLLLMGGAVTMVLGAGVVVGFVLWHRPPPTPVVIPLPLPEEDPLPAAEDAAVENVNEVSDAGVAANEGDAGLDTPVVALSAEGADAGFRNPSAGPMTPQPPRPKHVPPTAEALLLRIARDEAVARDRRLGPTATSLLKKYRLEASGASTGAKRDAIGRSLDQWEAAFLQR